MAAANVIPRPLTPAQLAHGAAAAIPSEVSKRPLIGILGVIMGAGIVTLTGRMIGLGLSDLRGHVGISVDDGAWIGSAFNVAVMFIGPFTVYLSALIGPRRILLFAAGTFAVICTFLPLVHNYSLLITALILAGLTSGTFYPLTLAFALRNIPLRFLPYTIALYATFVDMSANVALSLYGWYRDHLSWHWMFWTSAVITPLMMICIYYGIPAAAARKKGSSAPSFAGFLYTSAGLAILYAALDQGERLDWWRSGVFNALVLGGSLFLLCAIVRRLRSPNPLVDLPYLRQWNTRLLGIGIIFLKFCLLGTFILVPQALAIHGFEADQIGPAVIWTAIPQLPIAFIAGLLLVRKLDSRLLLATGFACMAFAACLNAEYTSAWSAANFYRTELLMGVGQSFAFIGLVSTIVLQVIFSGGLSKPQWMLTFAAFFHAIRLFGGEIAAMLMTHFIAQREKLHSNLLGLHVSRGNWITDGNIRALTAGLDAKSAGVASAGARAVDLIGGRVRLQAYTLSLIDGFILLAWVCVGALFLVALLRKSPLNYGELSILQRHSIPAREAKS
jgi:MFS transporter, DHA2 family, multidrug resistance protein